MKKTLVVFCAAAAAALAQLRPADPATVGMSKERLERAASLIQAETDAGRVLASSIIVARNGKIVLHRGFGKTAPGAGASATKPDTVYLLASISKPISVCGLMLLVERGLVSTADPASYYLPELKNDDRGKIKVRDLIAHTSGMPDMLPENTELRRAHAPLSDFVKHSFTTPLLYAPGTDFKYQSMGILLAAEITERVTKMRLRDFLKKELFDPLGMNNTFLGMGGRRIEDTAWCQTGGRGRTQSPDEVSFGANSPYWRDMGHPWGGVHSTVTDLAILLQTMLDGGAYDGRRVFSPSTVTAMTRDQNTHIQKPWGYGWALATSPVWNYFGDLVSPQTFGHVGATGTVAWADPKSKVLTVILTTRPAAEDSGRLLRTVSNAVAASIEK